MWNMLLAVSAILMLAIVVYLIVGFHRLSFVQRVSGNNRLMSWLVAILPVALIGLFALINAPTLLVVLLHLALIWFLFGVLTRLAGALAHRNISHDLRAALAIAFTIIYLGIGWYNAHHVTETHIRLETRKPLNGDAIRIVEIADAHLGITLDGESFARQMERVQAAQPDAVFIVGDFVDDDSDRDDMLAACAALGRLETTYGVYFVYGNHDDGYFHYRNFTSAELRKTLTDNHVVILEDEKVLLGNDICVVGRRDRSMPGRAAATDLTDGPDSNKYIIMLDHQPNDYANEAASGVDLVLSGHTHGGHIFPAGQIGLAMGANDRIYGTERRGDTVFVVTSGISGWAIPFKTGTFSEFVVIDVQRVYA